jgi:hypothetical protein
VSVEPRVAHVEAELLRLAKTAPDWETVRWLSWVGDCFDGGDFDIEDFGNLRYRLDVLRDRGVDIGYLVDLCQMVLDTSRTRERNGAFHCGNLRQNVAPIVDPRVSLRASLAAPSEQEDGPASGVKFERAGARRETDAGEGGGT